MPTMSDLLIYGAGGFAREVAWLAEEVGDFHCCGFITDDEIVQGTLVNGLPTMSFEESTDRFRDAQYVVAVGSPALRRTLSERAEGAGLRPATMVDPRVRQSTSNEIGTGTIVCAGTILTTNVRLHRHVQINLDCTVGHDTVVEDFATLAPGVHVSGFVRVGKGAYLGTGAVVINGSQGEVLEIGSGAVVGAGAVVTKSVPPGVTAIGVPARWADEAVRHE